MCSWFLPAARLLFHMFATFVASVLPTERRVGMKADE
jgi:hypothetical protein